MAGGLPQKGPNMFVFKRVMNKMNEYLIYRGVNHGEEWARICEKLEGACSQFIYHEALIHAFDLPNSPHWNKVFDPEMLEALGPHLYCTREHVLFTATLMADEIVRDDFANVLKAMMKVLKMEWKTNFSPLEAYFMVQTNKRKTFRYHLSGVKPQGEASSKKARQDVMANVAGGEEEKDKWLLDLNQLCLKGGKAELCRKISHATNPHIDHEHIWPVIQGLTNQMYEPAMGPTRRYGYTLQPSDTFDQHFARIKIPRKKLTLTREVADANLANYAQRYFRRAILKFSCIDGGQKTINYWNGLHTQLEGQGLTPELIIRLYYTMVEEEVAFRDIVSWIIQQPEPKKWESLPEIQVRVNRAAHVSMPDACPTPAHWVALNMALDDEIFTSPDDIHHHRNVYERVCHQWQGDYREEDIPDRNYGIIDADGSPKTDRNKEPVAEIHTEQSRVTIYFYPNAIELFDKQIIVDAFLYATMCDTFEPQKYLLGWGNPLAPTKMDVLNITREMRDETINAIIAEFGPSEEYRRQGVKFRKLGKIGSCDKAFLFSVPLNGGIGSDEFDQLVRNEMANRENGMEIIADLDEKAAFLQHIATGRPLHVPVQTPRYRREAYIAAGGIVGNANYPLEALIDYEKNKEEWGIDARGCSVSKAQGMIHFDSIRKRQLDDQAKALAIYKRQKENE